MNEEIMVRILGYSYTACYVEYIFDNWCIGEIRLQIVMYYNVVDFFKSFGLWMDYYVKSLYLIRYDILQKQEINKIILAQTMTVNATSTPIFTTFDLASSYLGPHLTLLFLPTNNMPHW